MSRAFGVIPQFFLWFCAGLLLGLRPALVYAQEDSLAQQPIDAPASDTAIEVASPPNAEEVTGMGISLPARLPSFDPYAAPSIPKGVVQQIEFAGGRRVDSFVLRSALRLKEGENVSLTALQDSLVAIYNTGYFDNVVIEWFPMDGREVAEIVNDPQAPLRIIVSVIEKPSIRSVSLDGNKKLDDDALNEVIDIASPDVVNQAEIQRNIQRMKDKYVEKGYYLVEIDPILTEVGNEMVDLKFSIIENRKVMVSDISFRGNESIPGDKIKRYMQTRQAGMLPFMGGGSFDRALLDADVQIIRSLYLEEGFVDVKVQAPESFLSLDKRTISVVFNVEEGPKYKVGKIDVRGDFVEEEGLSKPAVMRVIEGDMAKTISERWKRVSSEEAPADGWEQPIKEWLDFRATHPKLESEETFKLTALQITMQELSKLYGDQGYAFANVVPLTDTNAETGIVDVTFDIRKGDKVKINRISISGNDPTYDKVIRREIPINEGDLYSGTAIDDSRMRLQRLGFFEEVNISTPKAEIPGELDMTVEVVEQPTGSFSVGAGFSNLENFVFTANISKNNFLGLGYIMSLAANVSGTRQQGNLQLYDPYFLDSRWTLRVNGYSLSQQFIEDEYQRGGSIAVGRYLDKRDDIRVEFDYTFEDTGLNSIDAYKSKLLGGQLYRNGLTSTGGLSFVVDKRNNRINATRGIYTVLSANLSGGFRVNEDQVMSVFGGDFNFIETKLNVRAYQPLVESERFIFRYNGTLGMIHSTDGTIVPYIHRYRAGGINSIRGYDWFTLGPDIRAMGYRSSQQSLFVGSDDPTAADERLVVGGTQTWINNIEIESPIVRAAGLRAVVFVDAGNAFGDPWGNGSINFEDLRMAYGFGIRWLSPMGPLRFEWGFPVNPYPEERRMVFDFSMGSLF